MVVIIKTLASRRPLDLYWSHGGVNAFQSLLSCSLASTCLGTQSVYVPECLCCCCFSFSFFFSSFSSSSSSFTSSFFSFLSFLLLPFFLPPLSPFSPLPTPPQEAGTYTVRAILLHSLNLPNFLISVYLNNETKIIHSLRWLKFIYLTSLYWPSHVNFPLFLKIIKINL